MKAQSILLRINSEGKSFLEHVGKSNEIIYLILFTLYVIIYYILDVAWSEKSALFASNIRYALLGVVMWGCTAYLYFIIVNWKNLWRNNIALIITAIIMLLITYYFSKNMSTNLYSAVMDLLFCILAYKKEYRKMLHCILYVSAFMLIIAVLGLPAGLTLNMIKPDNVNPGNSLGIVYPNTWGYLVFLVLLLIWYLYLRYKPVITFLLFWMTSVFMYFYICCRTVAIFTLGFPLLAFVIYCVEKRADVVVNKQNTNSEETKKQYSIGIIGWTIVSIPLLSFAFMLFASLQVEWMHRHFYYTWFHNFAMRFVQGGLYFRTYGLPLIGNPYRSNVQTYINVNGDFLEVGILDSSFAAFLIMRGLIWIICVMLWLCLANWKALNKRDYAIPLLCFIFLGFAMMERPGLQAWFNFILLYPLAKVVNKPNIHSLLNNNGS